MKEILFQFCRNNILFYLNSGIIRAYISQKYYMKSYEEHISIIDKEVADIIKRAQAYMQDQDEDEIAQDITQAYEFAKDAHKKDARLSGEPYISHPVAATEILLSLTPDIATIQACLLHDVIEDTPFTFDDILKIF
jgi:(p)ppGpp synthase/HD superfamily hydrolase